MPESKGLLLVFADLTPLISESEFNDWYDNEHVPLRIALPFFHSATRLIAADNQSPSWAAAYDLSSLEALSLPDYAKLALERSEREKNVLGKVKLERNMYELMESAPKTVKDGHSSAALKQGTLFILVSFDPSNEETEAELHRFYDTEHVPLLAKVPGWLRSRRFMLKESGTSGDKETYKTPPKFLAIHEYDNPNAMDTAEYKEATSTPWRNKVREGAARIERRVLKVYKNFEKLNQVSG